MAKRFLRELRIDGKIQTNWMPFFRKMEVRKGLNPAMDLAIMIFQDVSADTIATTTLQKNTKISFRWSSQGIPSNEHHYLLSTADVQYQGSQAQVTLHLSDYRLALMSNSAHCSYGAKGIAEIVGEIASSYDELADAVIEKTTTVDKDPSSGAYLQCGENDWDFIVKLYNDHPISEKNKKGQYRLFWRLGRELHFHPPVYDQAPYRKVTLFRGSTSPIMKMRVSPFRAYTRGSEGVKVAGLLPDQVKNYLSTVANEVGSAVKKTKSIFSGGLPIVSKRGGAYKGLYRPAEGNNSIVYDDTSQSIHDDAPREMEQAELYLNGDPLVEPGYMIEVAAYTGSKKHAAHGLWLVEEVYQKIDAQEDHRTTLRLSRPYDSTGQRNSSNMGANSGLRITLGGGIFGSKLPVRI